MIEDQILKLVQQEIKERYNREVEVKLTDHLEDDLGLDSLDQIEIWLEAEEQFNIDIDQEEVRGVKIVSDLIVLVEKHYKGK